LAGDRVTFFAEAEWLIFFVVSRRVGFTAVEERASFAREGVEFLDIGYLFVRCPDVSCERALTA
jgi:hypothetical protein